MTQWLVYSIGILTCWFPAGQQEIVPAEYKYSMQPMNSSCGLMVNAGPDESICVPGGYTTLSGSIDGVSVLHQWSPATGLSDPNILNPSAAITAPITYTLTAIGFDPDSQNLIVNGDFELGNTGFTSGYTYVADTSGIQSEMYPGGTYTVIDNPSLVNDGWTACVDHTGGTGSNMMLINGQYSLDTIWCQTVQVVPGTYYHFSGWGMVVNETHPPNLFVFINGEGFGLGALGSYNCLWQNFYPVNWYSGSSTVAELCITQDDNLEENSLDFALDDLSFVGLCAVSDEVFIDVVDDVAPVPQIDGPAVVCENEIVTYSAPVPPGVDILSYTWTVPPNGSILSGQGSNEISVQWESVGDVTICLVIETFCHMNEGCLAVGVAELPPLTNIAGPTLLCPGETAILSVPENDSIDTFNWTTPSGINILNGQGTNTIEIQWGTLPEADICLDAINMCGTTTMCMHIDLSEGYVTLFETTLCAGAIILINGTEYGNGTLTGSELFTSVDGCDSLVEIEITETIGFETMNTRYLCPGDSIFVEGAFQHEEGTYRDSFITQSGCDSLVITEVIISSSDTTWISIFSCNPADTGTTTLTINQGNCDSTVVTTIVLALSDTTQLTLYSCFPSDTGLVTQLLPNQYGCDSLIMTNTLLFLADTTTLFQSTCDSADVGITEQLLTNIAGCDSLVITEVSFQLSDTTLIHDYTCIVADTGTMSTLLVNSMGCDSLVITKVSFLLSDTTRLTEYACAIADTGTTSTLLVNSMGCDSLVIVQTLYGGSDTTYLFSNTCSPVDSGYVISNLTNQYGCDSIISAYTTLLPSDTTYLTASSCEPQDTGVVMQYLTNTYGCDSLVIVTTTLDPPDLCSIESSIGVVQPLCFGDTGIVTVTATTGLAPFSVQWRHASLPLNGIETINLSPGTISIELETSGTYYFETTSANGLSILDTIQIDNIAPLSVTATTQTDMFGYNIPCAGDASGVAIATLTGTGTPPHLYNWSEGSTTTQINQLSPGVYSVTVTDNHGCTSSSSVTLIEPLPMQYTITSDDINCFGQQNGSVVISNVQGGVTPWMTSLDQGSFQNTLSYSGLNAGAHELVISDQNGCTQQEDFIIQEPQDWYIDLGPDTVVAFGQAYSISVEVIGEPFGTIQVNWSDDQCDNCLSRPLTSTSAVTYEAIVVDENGCEHADEIKIDVFIDRNLYIPNVFSPNDDQINDYFTISSASGIKMIEELTIYDRWGTFVFQQFNFMPDDPTYSWDGTSRGKPLNPGVYVYKLIARYIDDKPIVKFGDVTLIR